MHVLLLAVAVQLSNLNPGARAQDSAYAGDALLRGVVELEQVVNFTDRSLPARYIRQLTTWGADDRAWTVAARFDTAGGPARDRNYQFAQSLAMNLFTNRDTLALERRLASFSQPVRDRILSHLSSGFSCSALHLEWVVPRVQSPYERAMLIEKSGQFCVIGADTAKRRETLRTAANLIQLDTSVLAGWYALNWLIELRSHGGEVSTADLVRIAAWGRRPSWRDHYEVARLLIAAGDRASALPLLDSALAMLADLPFNGLARAATHDMRGTRADSAVARTIRDSLALSNPPRPPPPQTSSRVTGGPPLMASRIVFGALTGQDTLRLANALTEAMRHEDTVSVLITATSRLQAQLLDRTGDRFQRNRDSMLKLAWFLFDETMRLSEQLGPAERDSARAGAIGLLAILNVDSALAVLQHTPHEPRFRERALANTLLVLARIDADRVQALAASLRDPLARDLIYPELVQRALASGRLSEATTLAERTVSSQARVRTQLALATAELEARRSSGARMRLAAILPEIDPLWHCQQSCEPPIDHFRPEPQRDQRIIGQFAMRAIELGMMDDLNRWAQTRRTPEQRAAAWLTIAEAIAEQQLRVYPDYRGAF